MKASSMLFIGQAEQLKFCGFYDEFEHRVIGCGRLGRHILYLKPMSKKFWTPIAICHRCLPSIR